MMKFLYLILFLLSCLVGLKAEEASSLNLVNLKQYILQDNLEALTKVLGKYEYAIEAPLDENKSSALLIAIFNNKTKIAKYLIAEGANLNSKNYYGMTPLMTAVVRKENEIVNVLLKKGVIINDVQYGDISALFLSARFGNDVAMKALLSQEDIKVNLKSKKGLTPLMIASKMGHIKAVNLLLEAKANKALLCKDNKMAFDYARDGEHQEVIKVLRSE